MNFIKICSLSYAYLHPVLIAIISTWWFTARVSGVQCNCVYSNIFSLYPVKTWLNPVDLLGPVIRREVVSNPSRFITPRLTNRPALLHSTSQQNSRMHNLTTGTHTHRVNVKPRCLLERWRSGGHMFGGRLWTRSYRKCWWTTSLNHPWEIYMKGWSWKRFSNGVTQAEISTQRSPFFIHSGNVISMFVCLLFYICLCLFFFHLHTFDRNLLKRALK